MLACLFEYWVSKVNKRYILNPKALESPTRSGNTQKDDLGKVWVRMIDNPGKHLAVHSLGSRV